MQKPVSAIKRALFSMGWLFRLVLFLLIIGLPATATVMMIDRQPLVSRPGALNMTDMDRARTLIERFDPRRMPPQRITTVRATTQELNTLLKGTLGAARQVASRVEVSRFGVIAAVTVELPVPNNPLGRYVNIRTLIAPSEHGLDIARLAVGSLEVPPAIIPPALRFGLGRLVEEGKADPILKSIQSVKVAGQTVTIAFRPPPGLVKDLAAVATGRAAISDPRRVRAYYDTVDRAVSGLPRGGRISLIEIMRPVFKLARERSAANDPVLENEAALLAIAIYFGDSRFERFIGEVRTAAQKRSRRGTGHFRLDGRHDFVQHFTISMGLTLTSNDFAANIIGELKEAKDSRGSSGFSFTDIGADRAGVQFAKRATANRDMAVRIQQVLSEARGERVFFPRFADLPEGMKEATFRRRYGDIDSPAYRRVIAEIDRRIAQTPAFK